MNKNYKIDPLNGASIPEDHVKQIKEIGYNSWVSYFREKEGFDEEQAKDLAEKAKDTISLGISPISFREGLSDVQRNLLGLED